MAQLYLVDGIEFSRYHHAVSHVLVAYSITGAIAMGTVAKYLGSEPSATWQLVLLMGGIEVVLSQLPSLEEIWWVSALGTLSSLGYVFIALGLGLAYCGAGQGSLGGRPGSSDANKAFGVMNSLGNIAFAFGFAQVLMEIQDTLRQPPKAEKTMRKAVSVASIGSFVLYLSSAVACYAALGNGVPGEVLEGFEDAPDWLLIVANLLICVHMITAWQVWAQPVFDTIESHLKARRIRKQSAAAGLPPAGGGIFADAEPSASAGGSMAKEHQEHQPSPFDVAAPKAEASGAGAHPPQPYVHWELSLVVVAEASQSGEDMAAPSIDLEAHGSQALALALSYKGKLRSGQLSARGSGASLVFNTNPLPDLLPPGAPPTSTSPNDAGYLLPFWQRFLVRTSYVLVCTLVACVMVYKPSGRVVAAMKGVGGVMLLVCLAAAVGSVVNVIDSLIHAGKPGGSTCTLQLDMWSSGAVPLPVPPGLALAAQLESTLGEFVVGDWVAGRKPSRAWHSESWFDAAHMAAALPCLTRLTSLALDKCELPDGLPSELTLLTRLRVLSFDGISVSVDGVPVPVAAWSAMLSSLTRLVSLSSATYTCLSCRLLWSTCPPAAEVLSTDWEPLCKATGCCSRAPAPRLILFAPPNLQHKLADGLPPISAVNPLLDTLRSHPSTDQVILVVRPSQLHGAFSPVLDAILQLRTLRPTLHAQSVEHDAFFVEDSVEVLGPGEGEGEEAEDAALSDDDVAGPGAEEQAAAEGAQAAQGTGGGDV
ncbi:Amino acid permease 2 [Micractinium conductrix]|uniref:Amino acid permease 2 n=1 Tax=Micractinium conductrix TaxID=554055 RepID=A0A2P6UZ00_9CHLO|nr:Amino acid permease 2 [Micractinium conductrix]|eukprot:PSC67024.1 Amino acid permease 2 [Micractinium conductrix]